MVDGIQALAVLHLHIITIAVERKDSVDGDGWRGYECGYEKKDEYNPHNNLRMVFLEYPYLITRIGKRQSIFDLLTDQVKKRSVTSDVIVTSNVEYYAPSRQLSPLRDDSTR